MSSPSDVPGECHCPYGQYFTGLEEEGGKKGWRQAVVRPQEETRGPTPSPPAAHTHQEYEEARGGFLQNPEPTSAGGTTASQVAGPQPWCERGRESEGGRAMGTRGRRASRAPGCAVWLRQVGYLSEPPPPPASGWWCSVAQSCPTLCDSMDCSMPGFPVLHHLPEFAQTHVH